MNNLVQKFLLLLMSKIIKVDNLDGVLFVENQQIIFVKKIDNQYVLMNVN